jgi:ribosome-associated translation inhibitor RaiA
MPIGAEPEGEQCVRLAAMNTTAPSLLFSTEGFGPRADLLAHASAKADKVLRHAHPRVTAVRVHVKHELRHSSVATFTALAIAQSPGQEFLVHAEAGEPATAINLAFNRLERSLATVARARKHGQRHALPAALAMPGP